jgi:glutamate--cysteine ligase
VFLVNEQDTRPLESTDELRDYFLQACKPRASWRIGTEHEIIGVHLASQSPGRAPSYTEPTGIGALLEAMAANQGTPVREADNIIALIRGDNQITIEPGGQLEFAARPVTHADEMKEELRAYVKELCEISAELGLAWLGVGFRPFGTIDDVSWMPKFRYDIMREYMPTRGGLAHEMMKRTATVQVNLDYSDPDDARDKLRACMSVTSILTAIFASSPIVDGKESGYQSYRGHVWTDTDPDRCGLLDFVFDDRDVFEAYTEWALDVPLFFVYRGGYIPAGGITFRRFMREGFQGHRATMEDWALHLSTLFPEARMKRFIEVRGCDSGSMDLVLALGPLSRGLLYDETARREAIALTASLDRSDRHALVEAAAKGGLRAQVGDTGRSVGDLARELFAIIEDGLARLEPGELPYLEPVREIVHSGRTQADAVLELWRKTGGDPMAVIEGTAHRCADRP